MGRTGEVQVLNGHPRPLGTNTYGCLDPIEIGPLEALYDDIKRTYAHIMWLERYIAHYLGDHDVFAEMTAEMSKEFEKARLGKPAAPTIAIDPTTGQAVQVGSVKWHLMVERQRKTQVTRKRSGTHPAIRMLLDERKHLADITTKAVHLGIKLDQIDYTRKQADLIVTAMGKFAISSGLSPTDPNVARNITDALEEVLAQAQAS